MAEEEKRTAEAPASSEQDQDYIAIIDEMRENRVPKEDYDKLKKQNSELAKRLARGEFDQKKEEESPDYAEIVSKSRKRFFDPNVTNVESAKAALELRKAELALGHPDPFLPHGHGYVPNQADKDAADRVAEIFEECIEGSGGDSSVFTAMLGSRMVDPNLPKKRFGK